MTSFSEDFEELYARVHARNDAAAWKVLKLHLSKHFSRVLSRQVGRLIPLNRQKRLVEHTIEAIRRRTRLRRTWRAALEEARGRLARLALRAITLPDSRGPTPTGGLDNRPEELLSAWAASTESVQDLERGEVRLLLRIERDDVGFAFLCYDPGPARRLTGRKREISKLLGKALGNKGIARSFNLRESTVKGHLQIAYEKAGLPTRAALARYAIVALEDPQPPSS
jgi:DNA-binding CsgD family transcriptional regulator